MIGLYNSYRYDAHQEQVNKRRIILSGIWQQGVLCQGVSDSEKVRLSKSIRSIYQILWSTRDTDLRRHQGTSGTKDIITSYSQEVWNQRALIEEGEIKPEPR